MMKRMMRLAEKHEVLKGIRTTFADGDDVMKVEETLGSADAIPHFVLATVHLLLQNFFFEAGSELLSDVRDGVWGFGDKEEGGGWNGGIGRTRRIVKITVPTWIHRISATVGEKKG